MNMIKKLSFIVSSIFISLIAIYRIYDEPGIIPKVFFVILFLLFISYALFLIFENQVKAATVYKELDKKYLSKKVQYFGQELQLPQFAYLAIGGNILSIVFLCAIFTDSIPFEKGSIMLHLFYLFSLFLLIGSIHLTCLMFLYLRKISADKA